MARPRKPRETFLTWMGEGEDSPRSTTWNGVKFVIGEAVPVSDEHMIAKAKTNRFFEVTESIVQDEAE
jgi:hypothetical protein